MASFNIRTYGEADWASEFSEETARAGLTAFLEPDGDDPAPVTRDALEAKVKELIGWTDTAAVPGEGRVSRHLPMAHPLWQNLICYNVRVAPVPFEQAFTVAPADPDDAMEAAPLPQAVTWGRYRFDMSFAPRTYPIVSDYNIGLGQVDRNWVNETGTTFLYSYWPEWYRYCSFARVPKEEYVRARHGQVRFRTASGAPPDKVPYPAFPNIPLPDSILTVTWHRVPYRFVLSASSHLERFRNYVNQFEWNGYAPGSVLYRGYKDRRINPPFAEIDDDWGGAGIFAVDPLCDVDVELWITRRVPTDPPVPANANWIAAGWNCFPNYYFGRKFFYASSTRGDSPVDPTKNDPFFPSFPLEVLFNDPDAGIL